MFPLEVEQRLRGNSTRALVQGLPVLDRGLNNGHDALRDALTAEVNTLARPDLKKALARAARAQAQGAQGAVCASFARPPKRA